MQIYRCLILVAALIAATTATSDLTSVVSRLLGKAAQINDALTAYRQSATAMNAVSIDWDSDIELLKEFKRQAKRAGDTDRENEILAVITAVRLIKREGQGSVDDAQDVIDDIDSVMGVVETGRTALIDLDECATFPCENGAACTVGDSGYVCDCTDGWEGTNCEIDTDDCADAPCENGGVCTDALNGYTCQCAEGWEGYNCQINIDDCAGGPCENGGVCHDGVNGYTCDCADGWEGNNCQNSLTPPPSPSHFQYLGRYRTHFYYFIDYNHRLTFQAARASCQAHGMDLIGLETVEEHQWLKNNWQQDYISHGGWAGFCWSGAHETTVTSPRQFTWIGSGEAVDMDQQGLWGPAQPYNSGAHCAHFVTSHQLDDWHCSMNTCYVCETTD